MDLLISGANGYVTTTVRLRDRVHATVHADDIDRLLARGVSPEASVLTALRAQRLTSRRTRRRLAKALDRAIATATEPAVVGPHHARVAAERLAAAAPELAELRTRLETRDLTSLRGVASTRLLLVDGGGPVHDLRRTAELPDAVREVLSAFDTASP